MKIIVPLAGRGTRYANQGFAFPKPLIPVAGKTMIERSVESLATLPRTQIIFVALREHQERFGVSDLLKRIGGGASEVVLLDGVTEGQLCTVLAARQCLDSDEDLLIASSDTIVEGMLETELLARSPTCRGIINVASLPGDRWSFARADSQGRVVEVAEKKPISTHASTGLYYFSSGREFLDAADELIRRGCRTRGEYYVMPVYSIYIERGLLVQLSHARKVWDLGLPEGKKAFEESL